MGVAFGLVVLFCAPVFCADNEPLNCDYFLSSEYTEYKNCQKGFTDSDRTAEVKYSQGITIANCEFTGYQTVAGSSSA